MIISGSTVYVGGPLSSTTIMSSGAQASVVAPVPQVVIPYQGIMRIFKIIGHLIAIRRMSIHESTGVGYRRDWATASMGMLDQMFTGRASEYKFYPAADSMAGHINNVIGSLSHNDRLVLQQIQMAFLGEIEPDLFISKKNPVRIRLQQMANYMSANNITVEDTPDGFHNFISMFYRDAGGNVLSLPKTAVGSATIPDSWITTNVI